MIEKIKKLITSPYVKQFRDIRFIGFCVFGVLVLIVSWSSIGVIETNYQLQRNISKIDQQNAVFGLVNNNLKLKNEYFNTDQYLELQARQQFGKAAPGEKLILVPKSVAFSHTVDLSSDSKINGSNQVIKKPFYQTNFEAWIDFFLHRTSTE